jgi:hypothetical protein
MLQPLFAWLMCLAALGAQAAQPGDIVEVNAYGNWGTLGKVLRADQYGILVLYRNEDGSYNESTGFTRYFDPKDVRPAVSATPGTVVPVARNAPAAASDNSGSQPAAGAFQVGDRVRGWNIAWYDGTVVKVGSGSYAGYYLIKHDEYSQDSYYAQANVRRLGAAPTARPGRSVVAPTVAPAADSGGSAGAAGPKAGTYGCGVFLSGRYTPTQTITLDGRRYTTNHGDGGSYVYDAASLHLDFRGGALADQVGQYEPDNNAIIRLTQRTDLSQSEYTQKWRSQICSPR